MTKFSLNPADRLKALIEINNFIHIRNKKLKYCYNPMLIAECQKANISSIREWAQKLFNDNSDRVKALDVYLLGSFPIDKINDEDVSTITWIGAVNNNLTDTSTLSLTRNAFMKSFGDDFISSITPARRDTFSDIAIVFTGKDEEVDK